MTPSSIKTDRRTIDRYSLRESSRPWNYSDPAARWESQFPEREEINELEKRHKSDLEQRERIRKQNEASAHFAEISQQNMQAARVRAVQQHEDALADIIARSFKRRGITMAAGKEKKS